MEYILDTQTQRDIRSRLIRSVSLLCDDLRKLHTRRLDSHTEFLCLCALIFQRELNFLIKIPYFI